MALPTAPIVAASLVGGYLVARETKVRPLGGAVLVAGGALSTRQWAKHAGPAGAVGLNAVYLASFGLSAVYLASFGLSHPLAKKIGAWPAVLSAAAASAAAAWVVSDRKA